MRNSFNAAKYFFTSHRVAVALGSVEEQNPALTFRTVWPKSAFVAQGVVPAAAASTGCLSTFGAAASSHHPVFHDIVVGIIVASFFGFIVIAHIPLYEGDAVMAFVPLIVTVVVVGLFVLYLSYAQSTTRAVTPEKTAIAPQPAGFQVVPSHDHDVAVAPASHGGTELAVAASHGESGVLLGQD